MAKAQEQLADMCSCGHVRADHRWLVAHCTERKCGCMRFEAEVSRADRLMRRILAAGLAFFLLGVVGIEVWYAFHPRAGVGLYILEKKR